MKFIGLDAHSKTCYFVVLGKTGRTLRKKRVKTNESNLLEFVHEVKGPKSLVVEEGVMSQWLFLLFKDEVDEVVVCQPEEHDGPKNDEKDAWDLADRLRVGRLKSVFHADNELIELRTLVSGYDDLIGEITREKNRLTALFRQVAIPTGTKFYQSPDMVWQLPTDTQQYVACTLYERLGVYAEQRLGYHERFESNAKRFKDIKRLMSIPGIGVVRANQIVAIMVTPHRFQNKYHLFSYAKLTRHGRESDGKQYGKKPAKGQPMLKDVFKSTVTSAMKSNTSFRRRYEEKRKNGADDRTARHDVSKAIAATVLAVWKSGKDYDDKHREVTRRRNQKSHSDT